MITRVALAKAHQQPLMPADGMHSAIIQATKPETSA
jgi:hypothetical protein